MIPLNRDCGILPRYANRHGLITGATGTGKSVTLMKLCEEFANAGVPVVVADVKGDISGLATASPVSFYDVFGAKGAPLRLSLESLGPDLTARLLELTDAQKGMIEAALECAVPDLGALESVVSSAGPSATAAALLRAVKRFRRQGGDSLIGPECFDVSRFFEYREGRGLISILDAQKLSATPLVYSTVLLWLLNELFERMPEAGDLEKPRLVVFLDESHLLFQDCPPFLARRIEQIVRLIRSKGVGLYFVSQFPADIPPAIAGQLGNRIQHALRGATIQDLRAIRGAAESMPTNPAIDAEKEIRALGTGEALVSFIGANGAPTPCRKVTVEKPACRLGALPDSERAAFIPESAHVAPAAPLLSFARVPPEAWRTGFMVALLLWFFA